MAYPNPGDKDYHEKTDFKPIRHAEEDGNPTNTDTPITNQEEDVNPNGPLNYTSTGNKSTPKTNKVFSFANAKKKGPLAAIMSLIAISGIVITILLTPATLLLKLASVVEKVGFRATSSWQIRSNKIFEESVKKGELTPEQIDNLDKAGVKVKESGGKATEFEIDGNKMNTDEFITAYEGDAKIASVVDSSGATVDPVVGMTSGESSELALDALRVNKAAKTFEGEDYASKYDNLKTDVAEKTKVTEEAHVTTEEKNPNTDANFTPEEVATTNKNIDGFNDLLKTSGAAEESTASKVLSGTEEAVMGLSLGEGADIGCTIYRTTLAVGLAAKTVRTLQLAYYAMMFLNVTDQIKSGVAKPEDVSFLGTILTTQTLSEDGSTYESAPDGFGYKYAAYGEIGNMPSSTALYMAGAGLPGAISAVLDKVTPKLIDKGCKILGNPFVSFGLLVGGITLTVVSGGTYAGMSLALKTAAKGMLKGAVKSPRVWGMAALAVGEMFLPSLLKDIVAGRLVDDNTVGANAGDAMVSGSLGIMGTMAKYGGNAPLTPEQAVGYNNLAKQLAVKNAEKDRITHSPFDITNENTFLGSIVSNLIPYTTKMSSVYGTLSTMSSFTGHAFASIMPSSTLAADNSPDQYKTCKDFRYNDITGVGSEGGDKKQVATDPFCNVIYGIPTGDLNDKSPSEVANSVSGEVDADGKPTAGSEYEKFINNCVKRSRPLGEVDDTGINDGSECFYNSKTNGKYYLANIDHNIKNQATGKDKAYNLAIASGQKGISFYSASSTYDNIGLNSVVGQ